MTNAKSPKKVGTTRKTREPQGSEELRIANEIHTLYQHFCAELAMANPWATQVSATTGVQPPTMWPPTAPEAQAPTWPASIPRSW